MSAGRRGLLLSVAFFAVALWLLPQPRAVAQPVQRLPDPQAGKHTIWNREMRPDQVRELLLKFGQGGGDNANDGFEQMLKQMLRNKNPDAPNEQLDAAAKRFMNDKEFRDRVMDLAQRMKNEDGVKNNRPFSREDIEKLVKIAPNGGGDGDPFKLPKFEPPKFDPNNQLPPFDPKNPAFDPDRFPKIDPKNPPKFDPDTKFPLDPMGRPFDPRDGMLIDPKDPPKIDPPPPPKIEPPKFDPMNPPKFDPANPPKIDPKTGRPADPANPDGNRKFDPDNPLGGNDTPEKQAKTKAVEAASALWEKNIGPLDESPAVRRAIIDLVSDNEAMEALTDSKGRNIFEMFENGGDGEGWGRMFEGGGDGGWDWPKLEFNWGRDRNTNIDFGERRTRDRDWNRDTPSRSRSSSSSSMDGLGSFKLGEMQVPWLLMLILVALIVGAVVWWKWKDIVKPRAASAGAAGPMPWPIDPREINTREDVVKAFEFLSVLICGPDAKMWTHSTIADELSALVRTHGETAVKLARLYELARYAPLDEPLTRAELMEARRLVCDLAGMDGA